MNDPAAVIALLEKGLWEARNLEGKNIVCIFKEVKPDRGASRTWTCYAQASAPTFAEAGVRALLKAHGCEVGE